MFFTLLECLSFHGKEALSIPQDDQEPQFNFKWKGLMLPLLVTFCLFISSLFFILLQLYNFVF